MKKFFLTMIIIFAGWSPALADDVQTVADFIGSYLGQKTIVTQSGSNFHVVACDHHEDITFLSETRGRMAAELKKPDSAVSLDQVCPVQAGQINNFIQFCRKNITTVKDEKPKMVVINFSGMAPVPEISGSVNTEPYMGTGMLAGDYTPSTNINISNDTFVSNTNINKLSATASAQAAAKTGDVNVTLPAPDNPGGPQDPAPDNPGAPQPIKINPPPAPDGPGDGPGNIQNPV